MAKDALQWLVSTASNAGGEIPGVSRGRAFAPDGRRNRHQRNRNVCDRSGAQRRRKADPLAAFYGAAALQKESSSFLGKYLFSSLLKQDPRYYPSISDSVAERALYATSRIFITRKDSGQRTLNTSYFLGLLTAKVIATAYRPYWVRSNSITFKTFGSTIGSDMGMDLLHEFGPGIRQLLKSHSPKFLHRQELCAIETRLLSLLHLG